MPDLYLYDDVPVLKNKLDIRDEKTLDLIESEQSRANMMLLYERGFMTFLPSVCVKSIVSCLATSMSGPDSTVS